MAAANLALLCDAIAGVGVVSLSVLGGIPSIVGGNPLAIRRSVLRPPGIHPVLILLVVCPVPLIHRVSVAQIPLALLFGYLFGMRLSVDASALVALRLVGRMILAASRLSILAIFGVVLARLFAEVLAMLDSVSTVIFLASTTACHTAAPISVVKVQRWRPVGVQEVDSH